MRVLDPAQSPTVVVPASVAASRSAPAARQYPHYDSLSIIHFIPASDVNIASTHRSGQPSAVSSEQCYRKERIGVIGGVVVVIVVGRFGDRRATKAEERGRQGRRLLGTSEKEQRRRQAVTRHAPSERGRDRDARRPARAGEPTTSHGTRSAES